MKGSQISLSLISSCCYNNAIKLLTPEAKGSEFAYQEQQTARTSVHTLESNIPILRHSFCKQIFCAPTRSHPPSPTVPIQTLQEKKQNKAYNKREEERFACTCTWWQEADEILFQAKTEWCVPTLKKKTGCLCAKCELSLSLSQARATRRTLLNAGSGCCASSEESTSLRRSCFRSLLAGWDLPGRGGTAVTSCDKGEKRQTTATHDDEGGGGGRRKGSKRNAWHPTTCVSLSTRGGTPSAEGGRASLLHHLLLPLVYRCFLPSSSFSYFVYFLAILSSSRSCKISQIAVPEIVGRESGAQEGGA
jgi:hypothetical protein